MAQDRRSPRLSRYGTIRALVGERLDASGADLKDVMPALAAVCGSLVDRVQVQGAAVILGSVTATAGVIAASDDTARAHAELQFTTGEGPCHDAADLHRPVLVPNLASSAARWPGYASAASEAGVRAVFAFPLQVGAVVLGVLEVHHDAAGSLGDERLLDVRTYAQLATDALLDGRLLTSDGALEVGLASAFDYRAEIHQAQGMLLVSLGITLTEALVRMRAYAFSRSRPLIDVARDVHNGHLLEDGGP